MNQIDYCAAKDDRCVKGGFDLVKKLKKAGKKLENPTAWKAAHPKPPTPVAETHPDRIMLASNEFFSGRARWRFEQRADGVLVRRLSSRKQLFVPFHQLADLARGQGIFKI